MNTPYISNMTNFTIGTIAPLAGIVISITTVNQYLQTASLGVGLLVGICSLIIAIKKIFKP